MATYKVLQDIEAEDKIIGPLTLRQFVYAAIVVASGIIAYKMATISPYLIIPFLPHMFFFGLLAAPFGGEQSSEVWLLAKIRFLLKPQRRIWDQSGLKELVTITVPKKIEHQFTNGLTQTEVKSRLQALANTIDSRGWAVKNVNVNLFAQPSYVLGQTDSDRLVDPSTIPQEVPAYDVQPADDILDEQTSRTAQNFDKLISTSAQTRRQQITTQMQQAANGQPGSTAAAQPADYWFMHQAPQASTQPDQAVFTGPARVTPGTDDQAAPAQALSEEEERQLSSRLRARKDQPGLSNSHMRTLQPPSAKQIKRDPAAQAKSHAAPAGDNRDHTTSSAAVDPAIIELASNDDLNVATIARQANKARPQEPSDDEVVISLR